MVNSTANARPVADVPIKPIIKKRSINLPGHFVEYSPRTPSQAALNLRIGIFL